MPITFKCEICNVTLRVSSKKAGKSAQCPKCREEIRIPTVNLAKQLSEDSGSGVLRAHEFRDVSNSRNSSSKGRRKKRGTRKKTTQRAGKDNAESLPKLDHPELGRLLGETNTSSYSAVGILAVAILVFFGITLVIRRQPSYLMGGFVFALAVGLLVPILIFGRSRVKIYSSGLEQTHYSRTVAIPLSEIRDLSFAMDRIGAEVDIRSLESITRFLIGHSINLGYKTGMRFEAFSESDNIGFEIQFSHGQNELPEGKREICEAIGELLSKFAKSKGRDWYHRVKSGECIDWTPHLVLTPNCLKARMLLEHSSFLQKEVVIDYNSVSQAAIQDTNIDSLNIGRMLRLPRHLFPSKYLGPIVWKRTGSLALLLYDRSGKKIIASISEMNFFAGWEAFRLLCNSA